MNRRGLSVNLISNGTIDPNLHFGLFAQDSTPTIPQTSWTTPMPHIIGYFLSLTMISKIKELFVKLFFFYLYHRK